MEISHYVPVHIKQYLERSAVSILRTLKLFTREVCIFNIFYCFCMLVKKIAYISGAYESEWQRCYNAKPSAYYFHVKPKISVDFRICISVPLFNPEQFIYDLNFDPTASFWWVFLLLIKVNSHNIFFLCLQYALKINIISESNSTKNQNPRINKRKIVYIN